MFFSLIAATSLIAGVPRPVWLVLGGFGPGVLCRARHFLPQPLLLFRRHTEEGQDFLSINLCNLVRMVEHGRLRRDELRSDHGAGVPDPIIRGLK